MVNTNVHVHNFNSYGFKFPLVIVDHHENFNKQYLEFKFKNKEYYPAKITF